MEVVVESPATTEMQLFYLLPGQKSFTEPQSEKRPLRSGHNVVYFELPDPAWTGVLRLDPGMMPGVYLIRSIKAKTAPAAGDNQLGSARRLIPFRARPLAPFELIP